MMIIHRNMLPWYFKVIAKLSSMGYILQFMKNVLTSTPGQECDFTKIQNVSPLLLIAETQSGKVFICVFII